MENKINNYIFNVYKTINLTNCLKKYKVKIKLHISNKYKKTLIFLYYNSTNMLNKIKYLKYRYKKNKLNFKLLNI
ncbi:MAG TPA: hypothetical protein ACYCC7_01175 [Candidatus Azoamicus sp. MARI]